jgi:hypothetical protein
MYAFKHKQVSPAALAVALLICSALWLVGVCEMFTSGSKDGWSSTPLFWMMILTVTPLLCIVIGAALVIIRKRSKFSSFEWWALFVAFFPVAAFTLVAIEILCYLI